MAGCQANSSTCWKNILGWLGWSSSGSPTMLYHGHRVETSPNKMANIMNNFYVNKVANIRAALPPPSEDPLARLRALMAGSTAPEFSLLPVHPDTIHWIIKNLKNSKASGWDNIDTYIIKLIGQDIVPALTHIVNTSITTAVFPACYKTSKIIPLLKSTQLDKLDPSSYRPVSLLSVASKILERVVFLQVVEYLDTHGLLHSNHHGFRANHSVTTGILQMYDSWMDALENEEMTGLTLVDLSAAFDCVDVNLLMEKLKLYKFDRHTCQWVWSFMTGRLQVTEVEASASAALRVGDIGVPQGSILAPIWYIIFTNELPEVVHFQNCKEKQEIQNEQQQENEQEEREPGVDGGRGQVGPQTGPLADTDTAWRPHYRTGDEECGALVCYADDSSSSISDPSIEELATSMKLQYSSISSFLTASLLKVNDSKTHTMLLTTSQLRRQRNLNMTVEIGSVRQKTSPVERLLGLQLHQDLKFREHIQDNEKSLIKSLNTRLKALQKIKRVTSFNQRLAIANGIFNSKAVFLISVWGGCEDYLLDSLQVIINKAMRVICNVGKSVKIEVLQQKTGWLSIRQAVMYHSLMDARRVMTTRQPAYLHHKLSLALAEGERLHNTRYGAQQAAPRLALIQSSWLHRAAAGYRRLPGSLVALPRGAGKDKAFKGKLKKWVVQNVN